MTVSDSPCDTPAFASLLTAVARPILRQRLLELNRGSTSASSADDPELGLAWLEQMRNRWQALQRLKSDKAGNNDTLLDDLSYEQSLTAWLIELFNAIFAPQNTVLVRGDNEPEYFPATQDHPARIVFAHGFFASALHEISHWCIAGRQRRQLPDYGYWYAADGRNQAQQQAFEQVEIKPQAIECLFTLACQRSFRVSQDNLFADFDTSQSTFAQDVFEQALHYTHHPSTLPRDAQRLLALLLTICD